MEIIVKGEEFYVKKLGENLSEDTYEMIGDCTADCGSFCVDCTLGWN